MLRSMTGLCLMTEVLMRRMRKSAPDLMLLEVLTILGRGML